MLEVKIVLLRESLFGRETGKHIIIRQVIYLGLNVESFARQQIAVRI